MGTPAHFYSMKCSCSMPTLAWCVDSVQEYRMGVCAWSLGLYVWILANGLWPPPFNRFAWTFLFVAIIVFLLCAKETDFVIGRLAKKFQFTKFGFNEYNLATPLCWLLAWNANGARMGPLSEIWFGVYTTWAIGEGLNIAVLPFQCYRWVSEGKTEEVEKDEKRFTSGTFSPTKLFSVESGECLQVFDQMI